MAAGSGIFGDPGDFSVFDEERLAHGDAEDAGHAEGFCE